MLWNKTKGVYSVVCDRSDLWLPCSRKTFSKVRVSRPHKQFRMSVWASRVVLRILANFAGEHWPITLLNEQNQPSVARRRWHPLRDVDDGHRARVCPAFKSVA